MAEKEAKKYPKSEWTEEKMLNMINDGISMVRDSEKYKQYLIVMSKFHKYSVGNTILILMQRGNISRVAGYVDWEKKFHRHVKRGAKAIHILRPNPKKFKVEKINEETGEKEEQEIRKMFYKPCSVFDISDTEGEPLPDICEELKGNVENFSKIFKAMMDISIVPVAFEDITSGAKGYYHTQDKRIAIKNGMSEIQNCKTICHEMAHSRLHADEEGHKLPRETKETEAESVAFVVCNHFGINTSEYSFEYLASWGSKDNKELKSSIKRISETARIMIDEIETKLGIETIV